MGNGFPYAVFPSRDRKFSGRIGKPCPVKSGNDSIQKVMIVFDLQVSKKTFPSGSGKHSPCVSWKRFPVGTGNISCRNGNLSTVDSRKESQKNGNPSPVGIGNFSQYIWEQFLSGMGKVFSQRLS